MNRHRMFGHTGFKGSNPSQRGRVRSEKREGTVEWRFRVCLSPPLSDSGLEVGMLTIFALGTIALGGGNVRDRAYIVAWVFGR